MLLPAAAAECSHNSVVTNVMGGHRQQTNSQSFVSESVWQTPSVCNYIRSEPALTLSVLCHSASDIRTTSKVAGLADYGDWRVAGAALHCSGLLEFLFDV